MPPFSHPPSKPCDLRPLTRFLDGELPPGEQRELERHLNDCPACQRLLETMAAEGDFWTVASEALRTSAMVWPRSLERLQEVPFEALELADGGDEGTEGESPSQAQMTPPESDPQGPQTGLLQRLLDPSARAGALGRLGKYDVLEIAGQGGMGLVLRAVDTELRREVALKTLAQHIAACPDARLRLAREARAAAALRHPHVIPIFGMETWRDVPLIVMPFISGGTLQQYAARRPLTRDEILQAALQIATALEALHAEGIVHRDLKPSNILLQEGISHVLLSDFGLARVADDPAITRPETLAGTPCFMSPEQACGRPLGPCSDLFSLGSVLYWLCARQPPFHGKTSYQTLDQIVHHEPDWDLLREAQAPEALEIVIRRLLAKSPQARWPSAAAVAGLLRECVAHERDPTHRLPPALLRRPSGARRRPVWIGLALAVPACGLVAAALSGVPPAPPSVEPSGSEAAAPPLERYGALDSLDLQLLLEDLESGSRLHYWLRRLAYLPVDDVPVEALPAVQSLARHPDAATRELANVVLSKNPFQEVGSYPSAASYGGAEPSMDENPFQVVPDDE